MVEVVGDATGVHKALELIASHLRKFLVDRSVIPIFEMNVSLISPYTREESFFLIRCKMLLRACLLRFFFRTKACFKKVSACLKF